MSTREPVLGIVHTVPGLRPAFRDLTDELLPGTDVLEIVDAALLQDTITHGTVRESTVRRLTEHVADLADRGADLVLVTCSTLGTTVDELAPMSQIPIVRVDVAMVEQALAIGERVGVLATLRTTLDPTVALIRRLADEHRRPVTVVERLCDGAFESLAAGDREAHDSAIRSGYDALRAEVDVVILAQASMAQALTSLEDGPPVISSPRLGVEHVAGLVSELRPPD